MAKSAMAPQEIRELPGVGKEKAQVLYEAGYRSLTDVLEASVEELAGVEGVTKTLAKKLKKESEALREEEASEALSDLVTEYFAVETEYRSLERSRERLRKDLSEALEKEGVKRVRNAKGSVEMRRVHHVVVKDVLAALEIAEKLGKVEKVVRIRGAELLKAAKKHPKDLETLRKVLREEEDHVLFAKVAKS